MFIEYFKDKPKYRHRCHPTKGFKYGIQIDLYDDTENGMEISIEDFIFPFIGWLVETYGNNPKRYEPLFDHESDTAFVYFKDNEDRVAFKIIWGEREAEWDDDNDCFINEGIKIDSILHVG